MHKMYEFDYACGSKTVCWVQIKSHIDQIISTIKDGIDQDFNVCVKFSF